MACQIEITAHPGYVHARVTGERTPDNALRFLRETYAACMKAGVSAALLEMRLAGPSMDVGAIYDVISKGSPDGSKLRRVAYVEDSGDPDRARFAETVAVNRGVNVRLFSGVEEAKRWLEQ